MQNRSNKQLAILLALTMIAPATATAIAGDGGNISQYGVPSRIRGVGTYAGNIYAERFRKNGNYFYVGGSDGYYPPQELPKPPLARNGAKIIDVQEALSAMDCDEATKICLIKP
ncbi:MAG: hypothetical protein GY789_21760 [Hyphomicrobiales bacterium]|nr:hypothetical protein [Hyphomicrobiales bacterium]MCP5001148.1 hypothetical protein [Hyphomicrobiales bacterium]